MGFIKIVVGTFVGVCLSHAAIIYFVSHHPQEAMQVVAFLSGNSNANPWLQRGPQPPTPPKQ